MKSPHSKRPSPARLGKFLEFEIGEMVELPDFTKVQTIPAKPDESVAPKVMYDVAKPRV